MEGTPVGDGVNALKSLLLPSNKRATTVVTSASSARLSSPKSVESSSGRRQVQITNVEDLAIAKQRWAIKDTIKPQGIPEVQAPPPIRKLIDTLEAWFDKLTTGWFGRLTTQPLP